MAFETQPANPHPPAPPPPPPQRNLVLLNRGKGLVATAHLPRISLHQRDRSAPRRHNLVAAIARLGTCGQGDVSPPPPLILHTTSPSARDVDEAF